MATISIPEKTLEHWASIYLSYRFRTKAQIWWPAMGEDIDVRWLPSRPGKAVQLELKTTRILAGGVHRLDIDLGQLWDYSRRPHHLRPFYVFPIPDWQGDFEAVAYTNGVVPAECAYRRSGETWWFGDWMWVLTTDEIVGLLHGELADHAKSERKTTKTALTVTVGDDGVGVEWNGGGGRPVGLTGWSDFWRELSQCGRDSWPQVLQIPTGVLPPGDRDRLTRTALNRHRREGLFERWYQPTLDVEFVRYVSDRDGGFIPEEGLRANQPGQVPDVPQHDGAATVQIPL